LNSQGQVKSENVDVIRMIVVNGARVEQLMERNGQLPSAKEQRKSDDDIDKLKHETADEQTAVAQRPGKQGFPPGHSRGV